MINNKYKKIITFYMIKDIKSKKIKKDKLIDWFIQLCIDENNDLYDLITVNDLIKLAENIGIEVRS